MHLQELADKQEIDELLCIMITCLWFWNTSKNWVLFNSTGPTVRKVRDERTLNVSWEFDYNSTSGTKRDDKETKEKHPHWSLGQTGSFY